MAKKGKSVSEETAIWIGNDHGGFELKSQIVEHLASKGIAVRDVGCHTEEIVRYPYYAALVAEAIVKQEAGRGILICSTGIGMSIIANRYRGVRASLCTSAHMGKMTRAHNDSNVLCLGGKITAKCDALEILDAWLATPFKGGRHQISLGLIRDAETAISSCGVWEPADPMDDGKKRT
jgi:ribose 5-phosphate isomerase B